MGQREGGALLGELWGPLLASCLLFFWGFFFLLFFFALGPPGSPSGFLLSGHGLVSPMFGVCGSFALKGPVELGCGITSGVGASTTYPTIHSPTPHHRSRWEPHRGPSWPGLASGPAQLPSFDPAGPRWRPGPPAHGPGLPSSCGKDKRRTLGPSQVGAYCLRDRAGWSPAVDLALNLFTAE